MEIFQKEGNTIIWGDVIDVLQESIPDGSVDLIFADPPYNLGKAFAGKKKRKLHDDEYLDWCYRWIDLCIAKLQPAGSFYIMNATQYMPFIDVFLRTKMTILSRVVWHYDSSGVQAKRYFGSLYEPILHCVKDSRNYTFNADDILVEAKTGAVRKLIDYRKPIPSVYNSKKVPGNVWSFPRIRYRSPEYEQHPSQKPESLLERIILASSCPGDTVLDPFAGTFTTCSVAKRLNRRSIGIELALDYVKIGLRRVGIATHYKGESIKKTPRSYEKELPHASSLDSSCQSRR